MDVRDLIKTLLDIEVNTGNLEKLRKNPQNYLKDNENLKIYFL